MDQHFWTQDFFNHRIIDCFHYRIIDYFHHRIIWDTNFVDLDATNFYTILYLNFWIHRFLDPKLYLDQILFGPYFFCTNFVFDLKPLLFKILFFGPEMFLDITVFCIKISWTQQFFWPKIYFGQHFSRLKKWSTLEPKKYKSKLNCLKWKES